MRHGLYHLPGFSRQEDDEMREKWMAVGANKGRPLHQSALALLDLSDNIPDAVHLLLGCRYRGLRRPAGVVIHTRPDEEEVDTVWREELPLTAPARTLVDIAGELQPEQLEMALRQAFGRGLLTARELEEEARGRGRPGRDKQRACGGDLVRYENAAAFRMALEQRLKTEAETTGFGLA